MYIYPIGEVRYAFISPSSVSFFAVPSLLQFSLSHKILSDFSFFFQHQIYLVNRTVARTQHTLSLLIKIVHSVHNVVFNWEWWMAWQGRKERRLDTCSQTDRQSSLVGVASKQCSNYLSKKFWKPWPSSARRHPRSFLRLALSLPPLAVLSA